ncbi:MAG: lipoprotein, partial [Pseudomonas sp.]|nr:lipoprotein [Pseudomonas sp.]
GECQWLFRTSGKPRILRKILNCKTIDAQGERGRGQPFAAFTPDQLPGKTVKMHIKLAEEERPAIGDTWVKVTGGWKRCMGDNFEDQYAFCFGNYKDFSIFKMVDGRICTIYPGCTE